MKHDIVKESEFLKEIEEWIKPWRYDINKSLERNLALFCSDLGGKGELFASLISGKSGTGSGGSGFDLSDKVLGDESKFTSWVQSKVCNSCVNLYCEENNIPKANRKNFESKFKIIFFYDKCPNCNNSEFTYKHDSRWGIDSKAGIEYKDKMENYWLQVLEPEEYKSDCRKFTYKCYKISAHNENFSEYLLNQRENGSKDNCNLLPYSYDFWRFSPVKVVEVSIDISTDKNIVSSVFFNLENTEVEKAPITGKNSEWFEALSKEECKSVLTEGFKLENIYPYTKSKSKSWSKKDKLETKTETESSYLKNLIKSQIGDANVADYLTIRDKALGKDRGVTVRGL